MDWTAAMQEQGAKEKASLEHPDAVWQELDRCVCNERGTRARECSGNMYTYESLGGQRAVVLANQN